MADSKKMGAKNGDDAGSSKGKSLENFQSTSEQGARPKLKPVSNLPNGVISQQSESRPEPERMNGFGSSIKHRKEDAGNCIEMDSENDSEEDEYCIYTYKGDKVDGTLADLPSSFFQLDLMNSECERAVPQSMPDSQSNGGVFSPEMDFLEMDFDPSANCDPESDLDEPQETKRVENHCSFFNPCIEGLKFHPCCSRPKSNVENGHSEDDNNDLSEDLSRRKDGVSSSSKGEVKVLPKCTNNLGSAPELCCEEDLGQPSSSAIVQSRSFQNHLSGQTPSLRAWPVKDAEKRVKIKSNEQVVTAERKVDSSTERWLGQDANIFNIQPEDPELEDYNLQTALYNSIKSKRLVLDKQTSYPCSDESNLTTSHNGSPIDGPVEKTMIWSEGQACARQVSQIGTSACGATAIVNTLLALNWSHTIEAVEKHVKTKLRAESAAIPQYLFSRSVAGSSHEDLIQGIHNISQGEIQGRFFHMFPPRAFNLSQWLAHWMQKGAVPVMTLNLQRGVGPGQTTPDAWHHQMVFGVSPRGVYLTNPLGCVSEEVLLTQLCSPSLLMVRRGDVLARWSEECDLSPLAHHPDRRWKEINVLGQVVNMLRESFAPQIPGCRRVYTEHVTIPAVYRSGVSLFMKRDSKAFSELMMAPELPVRDYQTDQAS